MTRKMKLMLLAAAGVAAYILTRPVAGSIPLPVDKAAERAKMVARHATADQKRAAGKAVRGEIYAEELINARTARSGYVRPLTAQMERQAAAATQVRALSILEGLK